MYALALRDPAFAQDIIVVANLLGDLVGTNRFDSAARIALAYVERARDDDGTGSMYELTPALITNVVLAFASAGEHGPSRARSSGSRPTSPTRISSRIYRATFAGRRTHGSRCSTSGRVTSTPPARASELVQGRASSPGKRVLDGSYGC
ncbi:MAG TPA: hypothetical protein VGM90_14340 [Kofleriaceae bacterium]|jgi:hypothetical protein